MAGHRTRVDDAESESCKYLSPSLPSPSIFAIDRMNQRKEDKEEDGKEEKEREKRLIIGKTHNNFLSPYPSS